MTRVEFQKLQVAQLDILDEVHRVCILNHIEYYLFGGTALGAVRHAGFIPWDVDVDIAMMRSEYERFKEICAEGKMNSRYVYIDYTNTPNYERPHAIVCIKNTVLQDSAYKYNQFNYDRGIYMDVFPLDTAPSNLRQQKNQKNKIRMLKKLRALKLAKCNSNTGKLKKVLKKIVRSAMFWTSLDKLNKQLDDCMRQYNCKDTGYICSMASHYSYNKQCMPVGVYGTPKLISFQGKEFYAPEHVEDYLRRVYGDYMTLPPIEEQKANMNYFEKVIFDK